jgi:hypothetical protein
MRKTVRKSRALLGEQDVPTLFDDKCISKLATTAELPYDADLKALGWWIREAASVVIPTLVSHGRLY